ncbi:MAG: hypothetical protein BWX50_01100 [Euryarchaeota archaeon ADurb.Bin009]|nr:MAG: hypothetical protein BWX50_01100 [Euryarchaeota archaeon ADurb.Bin009]
MPGVRFSQAAYRIRIRAFARAIRRQSAVVRVARAMPPAKSATA